MTNLPSIFNMTDFNKYFVGADKVFENLHRAHDTFAKNIPGYPPYNIVKVDEDHYVIEMAVAGFGKQNIDIELANNTLTVKGGLETLDKLDPVDNPVEYIWKGIADRSFTRKFTLADSVEVKNAELINGMLKIWLENLIPEHKKPKKIDITNSEEETTSKKKTFF